MSMSGQIEAPVRPFPVILSRLSDFRSQGFGDGLKERYVNFQKATDWQSEHIGDGKAAERCRQRLSKPGDAAIRRVNLKKAPLGQADGSDFGGLQRVFKSNGERGQRLQDCATSSLCCRRIAGRLLPAILQESPLPR